MSQARDLGGCWFSTEKIEWCASPSVGGRRKAGSESCVSAVAVSDVNPRSESDESSCCELINSRPCISLLYAHSTKLSKLTCCSRSTPAITGGLSGLQGAIPRGATMGPKGWDRDWGLRPRTGTRRRRDTIRPLQVMLFGSVARLGPYEITGRLVVGVETSSH